MMLNLKNEYHKKS